MTISGASIINVMLIIMFQVNSRHHTFLFGDIYDKSGIDPENVPADCSQPYLQQREPSRNVSVACLALSACLSQVLIITPQVWSPAELFSRWSLSASGGPAAFRPTDSAVKCGLIPLWDIGYMWSNSPLELELRWASESTVLGVEGVQWCPVGWLKGSCGSSYCGSSPSDGGSPFERYGGGGRSNQGGRLGERKKDVRAIIISTL